MNTKREKLKILLDNKKAYRRGVALELVLFFPLFYFFGELLISYGAAQ